MPKGTGKKERETTSANQTDIEKSEIAKKHLIDLSDTLLRSMPSAEDRHSSYKKDFYPKRQKYFTELVQGRLSNDNYETALESIKRSGVSGDSLAAVYFAKAALSNVARSGYKTLGLEDKGFTLVKSLDDLEQVCNNTTNHSLKKYANETKLRFRAQDCCSDFISCCINGVTHSQLIYQRIIDLFGNNQQNVGTEQGTPEQPKNTTNPVSGGPVGSNGMSRS